jgi:hypothetical protein
MLRRSARCGRYHRRPVARHGGRVVYAARDFAALDDKDPAMPDRSPMRTFGGHGAWGEAKTSNASKRHRAVAHRGCWHTCSIHGHDHATAWSSTWPIADLKSFWGALGCACWAV